MNEREELHRLTSDLSTLLRLQGGTTLGHWTERIRPMVAEKPLPPARPAAGPAEALKNLLHEIGDCQICPLGRARRKLVFGVGNPEARVMLVGEGPGYMEDRIGEPFVGPAGQLLDKILDSIGLSRKPVDPADRWVYIANIVKCHPMTDPSDPEKHGNDRPPSPEEAAACLPFLRRQILAIRPRYIVTLGGTATKTLLKTERGITALRGRWTDFFPEEDAGLRIRVPPTYHPAALLRNPDLKKDVWEDVKRLRDALSSAA